MHFGQLSAKPFFWVVWSLVFIIVNHSFIRTDSDAWKCLHTFSCVGPQGIFSLGVCLSSVFLLHQVPLFCAPPFIQDMCFRLCQ